MCSVNDARRSTPTATVRTWQTRRCSRVNSAKRRAASAVQNDTDTHGATCDDARRLDVGAVESGKQSWNRRRIWHPPGETANPARTQNVREPCNSGGNSCLKFHLRGRSTANADGSAASSRATSSLPRSPRGLRRPRASRIRRAGTMMGARCQRGGFRKEPNDFL